MQNNSLGSTAHALVADRKGILAAGERPGGAADGFARLKVEATAENVRAYRDVLFTTAGIEQHLSGIISFTGFA